MDEEEIEAALRVLKCRSPFRYYGIDLQGEVEAFESEFASFPRCSSCSRRKQWHRSSAHCAFRPRRRARTRGNRSRLYVGFDCRSGSESWRNSSAG